MLNRLRRSPGESVRGSRRRMPESQWGTTGGEVPAGSWKADSSTGKAGRQAASPESRPRSVMPFKRRGEAKRPKGTPALLSAV